MIRSLWHKGFFHLLPANLIIQSLGFVMTLLVAKLLTPREFGEIKILQSYILVFTLFAGTGMSSAVLKFGSEKRNDKDLGLILGYAFRRAGLSILAVLSLLWLLAWLQLVTPSPRLAHWLMIYAMVIPFTVLTDILVVFLQARKKVKEMAGAQLLTRLLSFVLIVAATWIAGFQGYVFAALAASMGGLGILLWRTGFGFLSREAIRPPQGFSQIAFLSLLANGFNILGQYTDIFMLDHFCPDRDQIGFYSLAATFLMGAMMINGTAQSIATPYFSERAEDGRWFRKQVVLRQFQMALFGLLVAALVYLGAFLVLKIFFGPTYLAVLKYLPVLLLRYILVTSYAILGVALFGLGLVRYNVVTCAVATFFGLFLSYFLLQRMGIMGAAWAQVASAMMNLLLSLWFMRKVFRFKFEPDSETR